MEPEWSDLRIFLAIARAGTLGKAARLMGLTQPTMGRRLRALELAIGQALYQRTREGFILTDEGRLVLEHAERMEAEALAFNRKLAGQKHELEGLLRITSSEWFGTYLLSPVLAEFGQRHPGVTLELLTDARIYNLARREADLAFRIKRFDSPEVISRRLMHIPYALYGTRAPKGASLGDGTGVRLITMDTAFAGMPDSQWVQRALPKARIAFRSNNREVQAQLCAAGVGLAVLPRPLGDVTPGITALDIGEAPPGRDTFVGYHRDLRRLPRMRALLDLIVARLART
jgi:DNA-binding transcriptional LysR family regulator